MQRAQCQRTSRAARACDPSSDAKHAATVACDEVQLRLQRDGWVQARGNVPASARASANALHAGSTGPGVRTHVLDQRRMNHIAAIKAKDVDTTNTEPAFLLGGHTAPMLWDRLAESLLKANAVHCSETNLRKSQGAANQTTRISCKSIGQAAAAQAVSCAVAMALARSEVRKQDVAVVNAVATNAASLCAMAATNTSCIGDDAYFALVSTTQLVYNSCPVKLSLVSVMSACSELARKEMHGYVISNAMGQRSQALQNVCLSIMGQMPMDPVWCSWAMVVYLSSHPRGRDLLRATGLTDLDVQSSLTFERYGGEEVRRRAKHRRNSSKAVADASNLTGHKRPRGLDAYTAAAPDAHSMLQFWNCALQSQDERVLLTLAAHTAGAVKHAAMHTLNAQSRGTEVASHVVLQSMSMRTALKNASSVVSFVARKEADLAGILVLTANSGVDGRRRLACALQRRHQEAAHAAIHACRLASFPLRCQHATKICTAWSEAVQQLSPSSEATTMLPGVLERHYEAQRVLVLPNVRRGVFGSVSGRLAKRLAVMQEYNAEEACAIVDTPLSGTTRSFISIGTCLPVNASQQRCASQVASAACTALRAHGVDSQGDRRENGYPALLGCSRLDSVNEEPIPTPSSALAVGIETSEALRRWVGDKTRRNNPCIKHFGPSTHADLLKDTPPMVSSEPLPMLAITDFEIERSRKCAPARRMRGSTRLQDVMVGLHVCGDGASRVPEAVAAVMQVKHLTLAARTMQARSAILVASSQASFVGGSLAVAVTAGYANAAIASSKKIGVPDVSKLMLLSAYDCYVAGLNGLPLSFEGTCYSGTYGCRIDTGFTPPGIAAHNYRSDNRQHGNCTLSQEVADRMSLAFAKAHYVCLGQEHGRLYTEVPVCTRGIPHSFVPGVHAMTTHYVGFLETRRVVASRQAADVVDSICCLPFSPFTQVLRPDLEPSLDASLRTCFREEMESSVATGRAHLVNSTAEDMAIVTEPLFRRPCQAISSDCPFATSYEAMDSFFNACNAIALVATTLSRLASGEAQSPSECVARLHSAITRFVRDSPEAAARQGDAGCAAAAAAEFAWAADGLLLINALYPTSTVVGEHAIASGIAKAPPHCQRLLAAGHTTPDRFCLEAAELRDGELQEARRYWAAFCRKQKGTCAWRNGLAPLLKLIIAHDGSHQLSLQTVARFRTALETAVRAVWLVHSPDGVARPPAACAAAEASGPDELNRHHIDPVFVGSEEDGLVQRGCLVGLKPHSYRQVLAQMLGAFLPGVVCNVAINEGGLSLRVSSDPTILDRRGQPRTAKSISPAQTEGDESAYGLRQDRIVGAVAQKKAYDANALLGLPLFTAVCPPADEATRMRGAYDRSRLGECAACSSEAVQGIDCAHATDAMRKASVPTVACYVAEAL